MVNCSSVNSCLDKRSLNSSIGRFIMSITEIGNVMLCAVKKKKPEYVELILHFVYDIMEMWKKAFIKYYLFVHHVKEMFRGLRFHLNPQMQVLLVLRPPPVFVNVFFPSDSLNDMILCNFMDLELTQIIMNKFVLFGIFNNSYRINRHTCLMTHHALRQRPLLHQSSHHHLPHLLQCFLRDLREDVQLKHAHNDHDENGRLKIVE